MGLSQKAVRELVGHTFLNVGKDPQSWFKIARQYNLTANLINHSYKAELNQVYYYSAGISLELALKAIIIAKSESFDKIHKLNELLDKAGLEVNEDQECTLELLTEFIIWGGRYPTLKEEQRWHDYYDHILEKHIVREQEDNLGRTLKRESRFPSYPNYEILWKTFENEFIRLQQSGA
ncbi:MAG: HEPN domain-containing protein [Acidobacteria bacterium]|nr:HEPN domain-containing protein [Acidobacteriota bacterium]